MAIESKNMSLIGSTSRVETPFIKVTFGELDSGFTFGVYQRVSGSKNADSAFYAATYIQYPNYIRSLQVEKINGQVNQYSLNLIYPIRPGDDPNFFEKIFSSINKTRKIIFSYGDMSIPDYIYKNEQAIITAIRTDVDLKSNSLSYTISAISSAKLGYSGNYSFLKTFAKPSDIIIEVLTNKAYGLLDLFYGMDGLSKEQIYSLGLIPGDDQVVQLEAKYNISALDYIKYLVSCMIPNGANIDSNNQNTFYIFTIHDDVLGETVNNSKIEKLGGPYFQVNRVDRNRQYSNAYELIIGAPSKDIITNFSLSNNDNYSIYYEWQGKLTSDSYAKRINDDGEWEEEYAPVISSGNDFFKTTNDEKTWWTKITQFPISASVTIKGLLRPATLMQYVNLQVYFFGQRHISSGMYIVTKQVDTVDSSGYRTNLELTRISTEESNYAS